MCSHYWGSVLLHSCKEAVSPDEISYMMFKKLHPSTSALLLDFYKCLDVNSFTSYVVSCI